MQRRSFLSASAAACGFSLLGYLRGEEPVPGFDQTRTETDKSDRWEPFSERKVRVGIVGYGRCRFGAAFEFQNHPNVEVAAVSDLVPERCAELAKACRCDRTYPSLEELVKDDSIEAVFVATDAPSHARHCIEALEHGKHVCHAVPVFFGDIDDAERVLEAAKKYPELKYAMFETSVFRDDLYAMEKLYAAGVFGELTYAEGEYYHPVSIGEPYLESYDGWRINAPPLWYPTHSGAYFTGVTHGRLVDVTAWGVRPLRDEKPISDKNPYEKEINPFTTEIAVSRTDRGGLFRNARSKTQGETAEAGRLRGQYAGLDSHNARIEGFVGDATGKKRLEDALAAGLKTKKYALPPGVAAGGHGGSHGYLADDFIDAILRGRAPKVGVIDALNMTVPGYYAHQSALKDGETLKIPEYQL